MRPSAARRPCAGTLSREDSPNSGSGHWRGARSTDRRPTAAKDRQPPRQPRGLVLYAYQLSGDFIRLFGCPIARCPLC
jgi:hypothetical protein